MRARGRQPAVPPARQQTVRQRMIECLRAGPVSLAALSHELGMSQRQVHDELAGLRKQIRLAMTPARCGKCGFQFRDRRRVGKPGKCPVCRGTYIHEPAYSLEEEEG